MTDAGYEKRLFTRKEYERIVSRGIFGPDERTELIRGEILRRPQPVPAQADCIRRLTRTFHDRIRAAGSDLMVGVFQPVRAGAYGLPEPDLALLKPGRYERRHPGPRDVLLVVEISVTTLDVDRRVKLPAYAEAGLPEAWIVNYPNFAIEAYRSPGEGRYSDTLVYREGEELVIAGAPELGAFSVGEILRRS